MAVMIDIPGIGQVEAKNAASEATLKAILAALGGGGGRGGAGGGGAGGGGRGGAGGAGGGGALGLASAALSKSFKSVGFMAGMAVSGIGKLKNGAIQAAGAYVKFSDATVGAVASLARLDGTASSAADIFSGIPIIGTIFKAVAAAADDVTKSYVAVASSGATFGGSINNFAAAASGAGMTLAEFGQLIKNNSNAMTAFGTTTEGGATNFARVSKQLRSTSSELFALGFSTQDINQGLANYGALLKSQGLQGKKSNAELAVGAKSYLKEMDLLAKVTGQQRSDIEKSREAMAKDAQFQASMQGLGEGVRNSFMSVTDGLKDTGLKNFAKDILATGTATTAENQKLMSMMPQSAAMLQKMNQKMQRGEAVTLEERNALNNMMAAEGGKSLQNIKFAAAANSELAGLTNSLAATQTLNKDALLKGTEEQKKAAAETDRMNQKMQEFQAAIAQVSNRFKMLLVNSGILDILMSAFSAVVDLAEKYLVPAFNLVISVAMKLWEGMSLLLAPVISYLSEKFGASGLAGTVQFIDDIMNAVFPVLGGIVRGAIFAFDGLYAGVVSILQPLKELYMKVFGVTDSAGGFGEILIEIGAMAGDIFQTLGSIIGSVINILSFVLTPVIHGLVGMFQLLFGIVKIAAFGLSKLGDILQDVGMFFDRFFDQMLAVLGKMSKGLFGISKEEYDEREKNRQSLQEDRDKTRKIRDDERSRSQEKVQQSKNELKQDTKKFKEQKLSHDKLTGAAKQEAEAKEAAVKAQEKLLDYSASPEALLKQFDAKEGGTLQAHVTGEKPSSAASTEVAGAVKGLEAAAEKKKQEDEAKKKAEDEAKKKAEEEAKEKEKNKDQKTQESPSTLLAELNTKMATLLQYTFTVAHNTNETVSATRSLNKNGFKG